MTNLSNKQKELLSQAVYNHRAHFYIHLLNLAKRARVVYVKAYYLANKHELLSTDLQQLKDDLLFIYSIPILIRDENMKRSEDSYMLFDGDVADEKMQRSFNKEIIMTWKDIFGSTESEFLNSSKLAVKEVFNDHTKGIVIIQPKSEFSGPREYWTHSISSLCNNMYVGTRGEYRGRDYDSAKWHILCVRKDILASRSIYWTNSSCFTGYMKGESRMMGGGEKGYSRAKTHFECVKK